MKDQNIFRQMRDEDSTPNLRESLIALGAGLLFPVAIAAILIAIASRIL